MRKNSSDNYMVPALERGMRILELLARHPAGATVPEMAELELPPASLYRLLSTLVELGYVVRAPRERFCLGRKLLTLGYHAVDDASLVEKAADAMRELRARTGETVLLGVLYGDEGVVIDVRPSLLAVCVSVRVGHHFPLHSAAPAKAMLAFLPEPERNELIARVRFTPFTERTLRTAEALIGELAEIRESRTAFDRGEELAELRCVASPILDRRGCPVAAIWISGPESRLDEEHMKQYAAFVRAAARTVGEKI